MRFVARLSLLLILALPGQSFGAEPNELKYAPAVRELREYDAAVQALKKKQQRFLNLAAAKHERELADLREQATEALKKIQADVTKEGRLDDALAIRVAIKNLDKQKPADDTPSTEPENSLLQKLNGTTWLDNKRGFVCRFSGNTCLWKYKNGNTQDTPVRIWQKPDGTAIVTLGDWIQVWTFDDELSQFSMEYLAPKGVHTGVRYDGKQANITIDTTKPPAANPTPATEIPKELVGTKWIQTESNMPLLIGENFVQFPFAKPPKPTAWFVDGKVCFFTGDDAEKCQVLDTKTGTMRHYKFSFDKTFRGPLE